MTNHRAIMAANNNADWYSMMFDIHGQQYCRSEIAFLGLGFPPPYHSWMTTLDPEARAGLLMLVKQNAYRPRFGIKDAFNCLDLDSVDRRFDAVGSCMEIKFSIRSTATPQRNSRS